MCERRWSSNTARVKGMAPSQLRPQLRMASNNSTEGPIYHRSPNPATDTAITRTGSQNDSRITFIVSLGMAPT